MPNLTTKARRAVTITMPQMAVLTARFCSTRRRREMDERVFMEPPVRIELTSTVYDTAALPLS